MRFLYFFIFIFSFSCKKAPIDIQLINGQWEIEEVKLANGDKKQFTINENIEYFDINKGIHQKLKPDFDGNFSSNQVADSLVFFDDKKLKILTPFDTINYKIEELTTSSLILINAEDIIYKYKRYQKLNLK